MISVVSVVSVTSVANKSFTCHREDAKDAKETRVSTSRSLRLCGSIPLAVVFFFSPTYSLLSTTYRLLTFARAAVLEWPRFRLVREVIQKEDM